MVLFYGARVNGDRKNKGDRKGKLQYVSDEMDSHQDLRAQTEGSQYVKFV